MDQDQLIEHIRENSSPMDPLPTKTQPELGPAKGIRAVVFDIYGTLFISGSGDISLAAKEDRSPALAASLQQAGFTILQPEAPWSVGFMESLDRFRTQRHQEGIPYPEVRIEEVWKDFIDNAKRSGWLEGAGGIESAIVDHECRVNPCWPMPNLDEVLRYLQARGLAMGIVSNAQFYTPLLFPALLENKLSDYGFAKDIGIWSYIEREGKPSVNLYLKLGDALAVNGISPEETLYIGNDMRNDVWPAKAVGFQTVLFAGDKRSLRLRTEDPDCRGIRPDFVMTDLIQLIDILA